MDFKMQSAMNKELNAAENMAQMFDILKKYYDLENCKPGKITKGVMIAKLQQGVIFVGAKPKKTVK